MRHRFRLGAVGLALAVLTAACGGASGGSSGDEIEIVTALPFSGGLAEIGQDMYDGANIARQLINEQGGVNGAEVVFSKADVPDPESGVTEVNRVISQDQAKIIFCCYSSSIDLAVSQVTERNKVVMVEGGAIAPEITQRGFKYLLRTQSTAEQYAGGALGLLEDVVLPKLGMDPADVRVAIVHEQGSYGEAYGKVVSAGLKDLGVTLVANESYDSNATDLTSLVLGVKAKKPTIVMAASYTNDAVLFYDQARQQGLSPKVFIGAGGGHSNALFGESQGKFANGVFESSSSAHVNEEALTPEMRDVAAELRDRYTKLRNKPVSNQVVLGFSGMWALLKYVLPKASDPMDPDAVMEAAGKVEAPEGSLPNGWGIDFDETGQNTLATPSVQQWQDGELVVVYPEELATAEPTMIPLPPWNERG
ncbi:MAG TPA: ABC transporter substrate-binding protein [Nocardioidaceae bacterium]|nr:ABC transporter substrate-binding protein [Nocardioidaceae bacterium]